MRSVGAQVFRPETATVTEQVRRYLGAERLVFSEGSALHTLQLLGNQDADVLVLSRRPGRRLAEGLLRPRLRSLRYADASSAIVVGTSESRQPAPWLGVSLMDVPRTLDALAAFGLDVRAAWDQRAFSDALERDVRRWMAFEGRQPRAALESWRPAVVASLEANGIGHLVESLP
jgi:hypothetical protein